MGQDAVDEFPTHLAEFFFTLGIPEEVFAVLADGNIGVHAAAVDTDDRLGKEAGGEAHIRGDLAANQLVELNLVGGLNDFAVAVIDFELGGRDLRMVLLILKAHGALDFGSGVDEGTQGIAGKRVVVAAGVDVFKFAGFVIAALGVGPREEKALDLIGGVQRVALLIVKAVRVAFQDSADVGGVGRAVLVDHVAEDENLAGAEDIRRRPIEGAPIHRQAKIALALRGEAADRGAIEGQVVPALEQKFFVVVEHVQAAFEIAEQDGDRLDALFVG